MAGVCTSKALTPSFGASDTDVVVTQPVPRGQRYQFNVTRQCTSSPHRYIAHWLNADLTRKVPSPGIIFLASVLVADRISESGNAIASVRPSVRPSASTLSFEPSDR